MVENMQASSMILNNKKANINYKNFGRYASLLVLFIYIACTIKAQEGELFISNFWPHESYSSNVWAITQGQDGSMFFATRKGVISFDSDKWNYIPTGNIPYALEYDSILARLYVGCYNMLGYFEKDDFGSFHFTALYEPSEEIGLVYDIILDSNYIYCFSSYAISKISINDTSDRKEWISTTDDNFLGSFKIKKDIYVNITDAGLFKIENDTIWPTVNGYKLAGDEIVFSIPYSEDEVLIGTNKNELFLYDGFDFFPFEVSDKEYLQASVLSGGLLLNDTVFAISTLIGGCLLIDKETGKTIHTINYQTGLPDDEIIALSLDRDKGLWLSHSNGLSRVDNNFPVRNYDSYPGINGNILYLVTPDDDLYISTSEGVYFLEEVKEFNERIVLKKSEQDQIELVASKRGKQKTRSGIFSFFKGDKNKKKEKATKKDKKPKKFKIFGRSKEKELIISNDIEKPPLYIKEKIYELREVSHRYKKIPGINDKCKKMIVMPGRIIVAANNGLYEIVNKKARIIIEEAYFYEISVDAKNKTLVAVTPDDLYVLSLNNNRWRVEKHKAPSESIRSILVGSKDSLWLGGYDMVYKAIRSKSEDEFQYKNYNLSNNLFESVDILHVNNELFFLQPSNRYKLFNDSILLADDSYSILGNPGNRIIANANTTWLELNNKWESIPRIEGLEKSALFLSLFNNPKHIHTDHRNNVWLITKEEKIYKIILPDSTRYDFKGLEVYFTNLLDAKGELVSLNNPTVSFKENTLEFNLSAPFFLKQSSNQYQYYVEGLMKGWARWNYDSKIVFPYIPPGEYVLHVKARNVLGIESSEKTFQFKIKTPFWRTTFFYLIIIICIGGAIYLFIKYRERGLKHDKQVLSQMVKKRTAEIETQKGEIEIKNQEITSSLEYAKKIQTAVFPSKEKLDAILNDYFVFFKPRDIVSGDFYWATHINNKAVIAAADCTGHGVPGAFMSMLGVSFLNEIVNKEENINAAEILNLLRKDVVSTLSDSISGEKARDGIDLALCVFDFDKKLVQFAGAYNPVILVRKNKLYEYKANRMPVGVFTGPEKPFTNNIIDLLPGDKLYLFTDGYADQIGGPENKKIMVRNFKDILVDIHQKPMNEQRLELDRIFTDWTGNRSQIDDVLVIGVGI